MDEEYGELELKDKDKIVRNHHDKQVFDFDGDVMLKTTEPGVYRLVDNGKHNRRYLVDMPGIGMQTDTEIAYVGTMTLSVRATLPFVCQARVTSTTSCSPPSQR